MENTEEQKQEEVQEVQSNEVIQEVVKQTPTKETTEEVVKELENTEEGKRAVNMTKKEMAAHFQEHADVFKEKFLETGIAAYSDMHKLSSQLVTLIYQWYEA